MIIALSFGKRKTLGFLFPACGRGVTVPASTNPNPKFKRDSTTSTFLSKPAASPIGFLKSRPNKCWCKLGSSS